MTSLSTEFKRKVANLYLKGKLGLDKLEPEALESLSSEILSLIEKEKEVYGASHDLGVLEQSMKHLKEDSGQLKKYGPGTDDFNFALSDCRNLINSTKNWLTTERLI